MYNNTFLCNCMIQPLLPLATAAYQTQDTTSPVPLTLSAFLGTSTPCLWLPNACYTLICNLTKNYLLDLPSTDIPKELTFEKDCSYFAITFFPGILPSPALKSAPFLIPMLLTQSDFSAQVSCILSSLNQEQHLYLPSLLIQQIISTIANHSPTIQELSKTLSYSERHIRRTFHSHMNYSPKTLTRIFRFQHSLQEILKIPDRNNSEYIDLLAYSDQAHFQREFKSFTTMTPRHFIQLIQKLQ